MSGRSCFDAIILVTRARLRSAIFCAKAARTLSFRKYANKANPKAMAGITINSELKFPATEFSVESPAI